MYKGTQKRNRCSRIGKLMLRVDLIAVDVLYPVIHEGSHIKVTQNVLLPHCYLLLLVLFTVYDTFHCLWHEKLGGKNKVE